MESGAVPWRTRRTRTIVLVTEKYHEEEVQEEGATPESGRLTITERLRGGPPPLNSPSHKSSAWIFVRGQPGTLQLPSHLMSSQLGFLCEVTPALGSPRRIR